MENSKNVLIINDMPGYGKVALAAMLPVLSNLGHSVYNLPTALVSNTLDYGKFTILDTTDYMVKAIEVWKQLGFQFDCITTGFLASAAQVGIIRDFIASQKKEGLLVMTDPIMADEGKLYNGVTEETVENMRRLIGVADVMKPDYGDPVEIREGEIPVFWPCGVTPQNVVVHSKPEFCITHAPGHMFVTDVKNVELKY